MLKNKNHIFEWGLLLTIFLTIVALGIDHIELLKSPNNSICLGSSVDGLKNYYTPLYHVKYDTGYHRFEGMNYPYGEQVVFSDNQPLLSNSIKIFSKHIYDISDYTIAFVNLSMLFSIVLCGVFLYLILRRLLLPQWFSGLAAVMIALLSPQIFRMGGHYALAHAFVIPMIIYVSLWFAESKSYLKSFVIAILIILVSTLHFYYFALSAFFISFLLLFQLLGSFSKKNFLTTVLHGLIQVVLPFVLLTLWINWTSGGVVDRPSNPYGFLIYKSRWEGVFLPIGYALGDFINEHIVKIRKVEWEGIAYVGLVGTFVAIVSIFRLIVALIKERSQTRFLPFVIDTTKNKFLISAFLSAFVLFLFACGVPFIWKLDWVLDYTGPLKQFRGIGRFAWIWYYVWNIIVFCSMYYWIQKINNNALKTICWIILFAIPTYEIQELYRRGFYNITTLTELDKNTLTNDHWTNEIDTEKYQAILPLPYFHIGSENFWREPQGNHLKNILVASLQTSLPTLSVFMSRTSLAQTLKSIQLTTMPYKEMDFLEDLPNEKPLLVIFKSNQELSDSEKNILTLAKPLAERDNIAFYELSIDDIRNYTKESQAEYIKKDSLLFEHTSQEFSTDSLKNYVLQSFEEFSNDEAYEGKGCRNASYQDKSIFKNTLPYQEAEKTYLISIWVYIQKDLIPDIYISALEEDQTTKEILQRNPYLIRKKIKTIDTQEGWALMEFPYIPKKSDSELIVELYTGKKRVKSILLDNLLIRRATTNVYKDDNNGLWKNNILFR